MACLHFDNVALGYQSRARPPLQRLGCAGFGVGCVGAKGSGGSIMKHGIKDDWQGVQLAQSRTLPFERA